ncbi:MAG: DegT/DnrJ/EryC1/StrS family aminotransferase [Candidatus Poribacteria bacterium]|nr:DegT/DnrJ/EryC1/StrS family aminotransferase [Candidatus Poribacteria bacterium]
MEQLAIQGGPKVRTEPFPKRTPFGEREEELLIQAVRSQNLFGKSGTFVKELEKKFAAFHGTNYAQASTSGTAAIHTAVGVVNPNPGDEIITAPITDPGSVMPILMQNAVPVFADVDPKTLNMTPESIEANITDRTRAIILVHLFGRPCNIDEVLAIAEKHNLILIEDCCQTHATKYKGRYAGTFGHMGCFSFQQSKHMTTGDGGMIITNDEQTYIRLKLFSDKGWDYQYMGERDHAFLAPNYRMTEMQGAVGIAQLEKLRDVVERRIALGKLLNELIADAPGVEVAPTPDDREVSWWNYIFHVTGHDPDEFCKAVSAEGVAMSAHYIRDPIYMRGNFLTEKNTYGSSGFPFDSTYVSRKYHYGPELVPNAVEGLRSVVVTALHEHMGEDDIRDIGRAVNKVARGLAKTR